MKILAFFAKHKALTATALFVAMVFGMIAMIVIAN